MIYSVIVFKCNALVKIQILVQLVLTNVWIKIVSDLRGLMEKAVLVLFAIVIAIKKYKKQDAVKISAEIKRRANDNSNSLICDMPANEQAVAQKKLLETRS